MLKRNILSVLRRLAKQPVFTSINSVGLSLGLMAFLFILQYVFFQWSFNDMYSETERTYRLLEASEGNDLAPYTIGGIVPNAKENIAGIELASRYIEGVGNGVISIPDQVGSSENNFREDWVIFVDDDFLKLFERRTIAGQADLTRPNTVVLTKSTAIQYFQTTDVVGNSLNLINQFGAHPFQIIAVIEDFPENSDIHGNVLVSMSTLSSKEYIGYNTWMDINTLSSSFMWAYFRFSDPTIGDDLIAYRKQIAKEQGLPGEYDVHLQSIADIHLNAGQGSLLPTFGDARLVWLLMILAIAILGIAWINYVNLSTAQSIKKAQSVSVRKVIGASRWNLISHQLTETFLFTGGSISLAIVGCLILQPFFNHLVDFPLHLSLLLDWKFILGILLFLLTTSFAAGFYVAIVMTGFEPASILKGSFGRSKKGIAVRKILVTTQFAISIAFIAGIAIMLLQIKYLETKDTGINAEQRLAIQGPSDFSAETFRSRDAFLEEIKQLPFVAQYSASGGIPGKNINYTFSTLSQDKSLVDEGTANYSMVFVDENYFDLFEIDLLAGNPPTAALAKQRAWQHKKVIINEAAARQLGFENPLDAANKFLYYRNGDTIVQRQVLAVAEDYNHRSLHATMMPLVFAPSPNHVWFSLKMNGIASKVQLAELEHLYKSHFPKSPFIYQFVDEYYNKFYDAERRLGRLISAATFLAIFISCLGLFGLVTFTVEQRAKEIGIRKVLGASVGSIVQLISKDFVPLVFLAILIAAPLAYYVMDKWLADFAYRIEIPWWIFIFAGFVAITIALLTVSFQSVKAAIANPTETLRNE